MSEKVQRAIEFSAHHLKDVLDKNGEELAFIHSYRVLLAVIAAGGDENQRCAAILHDNVEDTDATLEMIRAEFGDDVAELVDCLTRREPPRNPVKETYKEFIRRADGNPRARLIKICDIKDNIGRSGGDKMMIGITKERYLPALKVLTDH